MNRIITIISIFILVSVVFCACGDNEQTVSRTTTAPLSEIATSLVKSNKEGKTVIYETDKRETVRMDIFDNKGNLKYTEEYLYNENEEICGFVYYDKNGNFSAKYISIGENPGYYYQDDTVMQEDEFSKRIKALGVYGSWQKSKTGLK